MTGSAARRKFPWWIYILALLVVLVFALWPVASVAIAGTIAELNGCRLHEGGVNPCVVNGADWGGLLYAMGVMGWFMLATLPLGGIGLLVWVLALAIHLVIHYRRKPA